MNHVLSNMIRMITSETHTIYTLDSDLSPSKLQALRNLSNRSYHTAESPAPAAAVDMTMSKSSHCKDQNQ